MRAGKTLTLLLVSTAFLFPSIEASTLRGVLPVAGSAQGAFGANFRTSLQLSNRTDHVQLGKLVFHPAGQPASEDDPSLPYTLEPHQTVSFDDVVATMGVSGLGSIDVVVDEGGVPAMVARAYDDKGDAGTAGAGIVLVATTEAASEGQSVTLVVPRDLTRFRFNIGVRTLETGATLHVRVFDASGLERASLESLAYPAHYFVQQPASELLGGITLAASDSISVEVTNGSAILYGTSTDNTTNDPSFQLAAPGQGQE